MGWARNRDHVGFGQKLLHGERCVDRHVIMVNHPVLLSPLLRTFPSFVFSQPLQHADIAVLIECLTLRSEFLVNDLHVVEETALYAALHKSDRLQSRWVRALPL